MEIANIIPPLTLHFDLIKVIGRGGNSKVWLIKDSKYNLFACKIPSKYATENLLYEAGLMSKISRYPNLSPFLTFYGIYSYNRKPVMVSEYLEGWELFNLKIKLTEEQLLYMVKQLYGQVSYLNNLGLCHGDIYQRNILYNETKLVLIDVTNQEYNGEYPEANAEVARTTEFFWNKAIKLGYDPDKLLWKKDTYDLGQIFKELLIDNTEPQKEYPIIDIIINWSTQVDISIRPYAIDVLNYISKYF